MPAHDNQTAMKRRLALKTLSGSALIGGLIDKLPGHWQRPLINAAVSPGHAGTWERPLVNTAVLPEHGQVSALPARETAAEPIYLRIGDLQTRQASVLLEVRVFVTRAPNGQALNVRIGGAAAAGSPPEQAASVLSHLLPAAHAQTAGPAIARPVTVYFGDGDTVNGSLPVAYNGRICQYPVRITRDPAFEAVEIDPGSIDTTRVFPPQSVQIIGNPADIGQGYRCPDNTFFGVFMYTDRGSANASAQAINRWIAQNPLPTTVAPTTVSPTAAAPTTASPTTAAPTTVSPTTAAPTTVSPTTAAPTTASPTTAAPATLVPTTALTRQTISWEKAAYRVTEPAAGAHSNAARTVAVITITRSGENPQPVLFEIDNGQAIAAVNHLEYPGGDGDFALDGYELTKIGATNRYQLGSEESSFDIIVYRDLVTEPDEIVTLTLVADDAYLLGDITETRITLADTPPTTAASTTMAGIDSPATTAAVTTMAGIDIPATTAAVTTMAGIDSPATTATVGTTVSLGPTFSWQWQSEGFPENGQPTMFTVSGTFTTNARKNDGTLIDDGVEITEEDIATHTYTVTDQNGQLRYAIDLISIKLTLSDGQEFTGRLSAHSDFQYTIGADFFSEPTEPSTSSRPINFTLSRTIPATGDTPAYDAFPGLFLNDSTRAWHLRHDTDNASIALGFDMPRVWRGSGIDMPPPLANITTPLPPEMPPALENLPSVPAGERWFIWHWSQTTGYSATGLFKTTNTTGDENGQITAADVYSNQIWISLFSQAVCKIEIMASKDTGGRYTEYQPTPIDKAIGAADITHRLKYNLGASGFVEEPFTNTPSIYVNDPNRPTDDTPLAAGLIHSISGWQLHGIGAILSVSGSELLTGPTIREIPGPETPAIPSTTAAPPVLRFTKVQVGAEEATDQLQRTIPEALHHQFTSTSVRLFFEIDPLPGEGETVTIRYQISGNATHQPKGSNIANEDYLLFSSASVLVEEATTNVPMSKGTYTYTFPLQGGNDPELNEISLTGFHHDNDPAGEEDENIIITLLPQPGSGYQVAPDRGQVELTIQDTTFIRAPENFPDYILESTEGSAPVSITITRDSNVALNSKLTGKIDAIDFDLVIPSDIWKNFKNVNEEQLDFKVTQADRVIMGSIDGDMYRFTGFRIPLSETSVDLTFQTAADNYAESEQDGLPSSPSKLKQETYRLEIANVRGTMGGMLVESVSVSHDRDDNFLVLTILEPTTTPAATTS